VHLLVESQQILIVLHVGTHRVVGPLGELEVEAVRVETLVGVRRHIVVIVYQIALYGVVLQVMVFTSIFAAQEAAAAQAFMVKALMDGLHLIRNGLEVDVQVVMVALEVMAVALVHRWQQVAPVENMELPVGIQVSECIVVHIMAKRLVI
jgi:hypothetical protein